MDAFLATILLWPVNWAPTGWALCNGQLLAISSNAALFSLLGTSFGGNGTTTFGLPDLRSRVPVGAGQGPGLSSYAFGQIGGAESVTLTTAQMPAHVHSFSVSVSNTQAVNNTPATGNWLASSYDIGNAEPIASYTTTAGNTNLAPGNTGITGGNQPFNNVQPYLAINYIIALQGIYPTRS